MSKDVERFTRACNRSWHPPQFVIRHPEEGGMSAQRPAGARKPASQTSAEPVPSSSRGSLRPDARTGRSRARRFSLLLPVLALLLGALGLFHGAPAEAQTIVWSATLTVQDRGGSNRGCGNSDAGKECSSTSVLTDDDFTISGTVWEITAITGVNNAVAVFFNRDVRTALDSYSFCVGTTALAFSSAGHSGLNNLVLWRTPAAAWWSVGDTVSLSIGTSCAQHDATLSGLTASSSTSATGTFTALDIGAFGASTTSYAASVDNSVTHVKLTPTAGHSGATVEVGKGSSLTAVTSGSASDAIALSVGSNEITVEVTAADGATKKTYTVTVTRGAAVPVPPGDTTLTPVESGDNAPTATTLSFTIECAVAGSGRPITDYQVHAVAQGVAPLERTYYFPSDKCGSNGPVTLTGLPLRPTATTWQVRAQARAIRGLRGRWSTPVELATLADPVQQNAAPLTASFAGVPSEHTGNGRTFSFTVNFSVSLDGGQAPTRRSFETSHGAVMRLVKVSAMKWTVHVRPITWRKVGIALRGGRSCDDPRAVCATGGRALTNSPQASVGGAARIRVSSHWAREGTETPVRFDVKLSRAVSHEVRVDYATKDGLGMLGGNAPAMAGADYTAASGTLVFEAGERRKTVDVTVLDDAINEGAEYFLLALSNPQGAHLPFRQVEKPGLITNDDPLPKAWLARFGRTAAGHVAGAIDGRLSGGAAGVVLGGHSLTGGAEREDLESRLAEALLKEREARLGRGGEAPASSVREVAMSDLLLASSFHMASAEKVDAGSRWSLWGRGARSSFEGAEGDLSLDGDVTTATVGFDYERARWLVGVALSRSAGDGSYKAGGACDAGCAGEVESTLTGVYPYARYRVSGTFSLWGAVGHGQGEMTLTPGGSSPVEADVAMGMAAAGARGVVLPAREAGGFELALRADVLVTNTRSDAAAGLAETEAQTSRVRLVLEGSRSLRFGDAVLTPSLEIGFRNDSGDAETGGGVEAGGSVRWASGALTTEVRARGLLSHGDSGYEEWGLSASVAYAPGSGGRGLTLRAGSSWGASAGGAERLWSQAAGLSPGGAFEPGVAGFEAEAAWGLDASRGLLTPYTGVAVSGNAETWRAGARWKPGAATEVSLEASLTEQASGGRPEGGLLLKGSKRW